MMHKFLSMDLRANTVSIALLIGRIGIAGLMLVHGLPKLQMLLSGDIQFPGMLGMGPALSLGLAVFAEVLCSILILFGLFTRYAAIPLIVTMLVAVFLFHANDPFAQQELGLLYLIGYLILFLLGGGKYSLDAMLCRKLRHRPSLQLN